MKKDLTKMTFKEFYDWLWDNGLVIDETDVPLMTPYQEKLWKSISKFRQEGNVIIISTPHGNKGFYSNYGRGPSLAQPYRETDP